MTVSKTTSSATFFGNGTATAFSLPFYVTPSDALRLYMVDEDGTLTPILSGFSFVGNKTAETTALTFTAAPTSGTEFYAVRETVPSQLVSLTGQVSYNPTVVEGVWDKLTRLIQEVQSGAGKLLRTTTAIPPIKLIGGRVLAVNTAGTEVICGPSVTEISEAAANAEAAAASAELAAEAAAAAALFDPDNFQPINATLTSIAALGTAPGKIAYTTGVDTWAEAEITAAGRALLGDADATAQRATLGLGAAATAGFLDEDNFASNSAAAAPSQQSTKAYVDAALSHTLGVGQTWQDMTASRAAGTDYQNTTGRPIAVSITTGSTTANTALYLGVATPANILVAATGTGPTARIMSHQAVVPAGHYYRFDGVTPATWAELR